MKNKISFLVMLTVAFSANCANASECVDNDCELAPVIIEQNIDTDEVIKPMQYEITITEKSAKTESAETCCEHDYNCPFETAQECSVWYTKPVHNTSLEPRAPHINSVLVDDMLYAIYANYDVSANHPMMAPLLERYKMLMRASKSCCTFGIMYKMQQNELSDMDIYNFMKDDANYFAVLQRCMIMPDEDISRTYSNGVTGQMVADVRNSCLCKNKDWFVSLPKIISANSGKSMNGLRLC